MTLHKSGYVEIIYEEDNSLIIDKFLPKTEDMTSKIFREEMNIFVNMCEKYKPEKELVHLLDMRYVITIEDQEWMNTEVFPKYEKIIKKMAFLVPTEIFAQVAVEQTMDEEGGQKFFQRYFEDEANARKWLLED